MLFVAVVQFGHSFPLSAFRLGSIQEEGVMLFFHNAGPMQYLLMREKNGKKPSLYSVALVDFACILRISVRIEVFLYYPSAELMLKSFRTFYHNKATNYLSSYSSQVVIL